MKRVTRNGVIAVVAASGAMAVTMPVAAAFAADGGGATAIGSAVGSAGLISGNTIQLPVHVPVNVCGNTVSVVGLLNPAAGNTCANKSAGHGSAGHGSPGHSAAGHGSPGHDAAGASAREVGQDSPGVISGNGVQLPVDLPVNVSGNSVNVVGIGDPAVGNESVNTSVDHPHHRAPSTPPAPPVSPEPQPAPAKPHPVPPAPPREAPRDLAALAHTGSDQTLPAAAASAALVLGGAALYRRFRPRADR